MKAWLVTWEWAGDHAKVKNPIAAILNPRLSPARVREIVELIFVNESYSFSERVSYANNKKFNVYPAEYDTFKGANYLNRIYCGRNPHLFARQVDDIRVEAGGTSTPSV